MDDPPLPDMAWRYSASSYVPRDRSSSRDTASKYSTPSSYSSLPSSTRTSRWASSQNTSEPSTVSKPLTTRTNSVEEHGPVWAKATLHSNPSSIVQRLKDRYGSSDLKRPPSREENESTTSLTRPYTRSVTTNYNTTSSDMKKDPAEAPTKAIFSSSTTLNKIEPEKKAPFFSTRSSFRRVTPEPEKSTTYEYRTRKPDYAPLENKPKIYTSSSLGSSPATSRYLGNKSRSGSSTPSTPTTPSTDRNYILEKFERAHREEQENTTVVVVTRATSPSQPSASIYVRTRRADSARTIEKTIHRPKVKPPSTDKDTQVDESALQNTTTTNKYSSYLTDKVKPRASYIGISSPSSYTPVSRLSRPPPTLARYQEPSEFRRSVSRDRKLTPEPEPYTPFKDSTRIPKPSPTSATTSFTFDKPIGKDASSTTSKISSSSTNPESSQTTTSRSTTSQLTSSSKIQKPTSLSISIETREKSKTPAGEERPRSRTQDSDTSISVSGFSNTSKSKGSPSKSPAAFSPPPKAPPKIESSSESESESEESTTTTTDSETDDDVEELTKSSEPTSIKKSITNFLQNLPNVLTRDGTGTRSRGNLARGFSGTNAKLNFTHVDSGERAWWLDSTCDVPDGILKLAPSNKSISNLGDKNHLAPPTAYPVNRQFSRDKDWLRDSSEEKSHASKSRESSSPGKLKSMPESTEPQSDENHLQLPQPIRRQWSDEKPWWQQGSDEEHSEKSTSIRSTAPVNGCASHVISSQTNCDTIPLVTFNPREHADATTDNEGDEIDVTPGLRRRRQNQNCLPTESNHEVADYQIPEPEDKSNQLVKNLIEECKLECSVRDLTQKLAAVTNGLASPTEKTNQLPQDIGDMNGMISKAKESLLKSQLSTTATENLENVEETPAKIEKAEIDIYWRELVDSLDRPLCLGDLDFTDLTVEDESHVTGSANNIGGIPPPPPSMMNGPAPPPGPVPPASPIVKNKKTVKLFWREVANVNLLPGQQASVWDEIAQVNLDTEKLEHLFESRAKDLITKKQQEQSKVKTITVLDNKRSNAINIGMTKLPPSRAIKAAILKMDSSVITKEGIEKLLNMLPTEDETARIQDAQSANPELTLGTAEQFLLTLASITQIEERLRLWAFKMDFENSEREICEPLLDLKQGIALLQTNKTFRAILSILLSIGNFLNGQSAKGFQIDYLSKVPEVKDTVNKHSLLHHICVFVMDKFPDSTDLYSEIGPITRAAKTDFDELSQNINKLEQDCKCSWNHLKTIAKHEGQTAMKAKMSDFLADCAERIIVIGIVHRRIMCRFRKLLLWLGVPQNRISTSRPGELFKTIAEFALEYRTTRERILQQVKKASHHREKSRSRAALQQQAEKKLNSKEEKEDAKLRQLLNNERQIRDSIDQTPTWRRHKKLSVVNGEDDSEILETFIKTAKQPTKTATERRRSRIMERKPVVATANI